MIVLVFTTLANLLGTKCLDYPEKMSRFFLLEILGEQASGKLIVKGYLVKVVLTCDLVLFEINMLVFGAIIEFSFITCFVLCFLF